VIILWLVHNQLHLWQEASQDLQQLWRQNRWAS